MESIGEIERASLRHVEIYRRAVADWRQMWEESRVTVSIAAVNYAAG